ncbi:MAG TPA: pyruvate:ferredoxin (flavodoxin) oxidoreductase [Bacteroidales bacterium]|nr:pyruvate:ferredoxin (flavodoxin) oxidoreductase [Bacteroidales bacterium]
MTKKKNFITCDGNHAASLVAYMFTEVAAIYPITPSSNMAENVDEWAAHGRKNIFGEQVTLVELQSEAGAAGTVHGSLQAGALTSTYTASQGLLLMIPNMYKISGELLPGVFHVSARSLAAQALSIFGDHSDVMSTRHTGFAMLATGSVQQIMDIAPIAHLAAIKARIPFLHFFDGFRTSHEIQKVEEADQEELARLIDQNALKEFRGRALNPEHPVTRGTAQNPDIYFQSREAANSFYDAVPDIVEEYMKEIKRITGREYHPFTYYGASDAQHILVAMGSVTETIKETIDYLIDSGQKVGLISVHLYRPFSSKYFFRVFPDSVKRITVLDRTKEPGANGDPLYLDIRDLFYGKMNAPVIVGGRYGLSSKDIPPSQIIAVFDNMKLPEPKNQFTVGIVDDVTFKSIPVGENIDVSPKGNYAAKFFGLGSDGTVGANKNSIKIIGDTTDKYVQGYFSYGSKKSGGFTVSHLRFGNTPIRSPYLINAADFIACHVPAYLDRYDLLKGLKKGGIFLLNSIWDIEETKNRILATMKRQLAQSEAQLYIINATKIAEELGLGNRTNTIMQSAFFKISGVMPYEAAEKEMKNAISKSYGMKGAEIVNMNNAAIDRGASEVQRVEIPEDWKYVEVSLVEENENIPGFIRNIVFPINAQKGDDLPVSAFFGREDGTFPNGTTAYEKRGIAVNVPEWKVDDCIQCNQCAYVCPHAAIRPFLISDTEMQRIGTDTPVQEITKGKLAGYKYRMQVTPLDCTGCGNCVDICPAPRKALVMKPLDTQMHEDRRWDLIIKNVTYKDTLQDKEQTVKNSQFAQPLFEFSGACAGCGETPYIKLITQLYGDRMMIANATGCSSIYGGSAPSTPYTTNQIGCGPAWANSLFEDTAEFGYGMATGVNKLRDRIARLMEIGLQSELRPETKEAFKIWLETRMDGRKSKDASEKVLLELQNENHAIVQQILNLKKYLVKKSVWVFGGDGWAYDIGFGGLDHVIASGEDINMLVMDTEVYSNTGGQASKATPVGAIAKFAASGKRVRKKDLGMMAMSYGYVYVAQVGMGANQNQFLKALREAEAYPGPSVIIAYSPCISHGLRNGMGSTQQQTKNAVEAGYWQLYRFNPLLEKEGKNPFQLDSNEPDWSKFQSFLNSEVRYRSLKNAYPEEAEELFKAAEENAIWRYNQYKRFSLMDFTLAKIDSH